MKYRNIGTSSISASVVGMGTWAIGGGKWWGENDDNESVKAIHAGLDSGINLIDTAPSYGFGHSEEVVGRAIQDRRDKVVLSTKCGLWWHDDRGSDFFEMDEYKVKRCLDKETIRKEIELSLKRLRTDYIDIYHTHWQTVEPYITPVEETMEELLKLKKEGKIRCIAVSNADVSSMEDYMKSGKIETNQTKYSLVDREAEKSIAPYCIKNQISILAYSPLEQGLLTGKIGMDRKLQPDEYRNYLEWYKPENRKKILDMLEGWKPLAEKYNCTLSQLVIACTYNQPGITHVLCGARRPGHAVENAKAGVLELSESTILQMRKDAEALGMPQ